MPKAIKKRVSRKTQGEDNLGETVADIRKKFQERQSTLVYAFLIFVLIVIIVGALVVYHRSSVAKAKEMEYEGYKIFSGATATQYASPADRFKEALEKFKASFAAEKSPTALLNIANCYYELGNLDEALKTLKELTGQYSDPKITSLAYYKMAITFIRKGDLNSALNTFGIISSIKDAPLHDMALIESGKILESMGKTEEAKGKYKELINKFPTSPLVNDANSRLGSP
ncbi:MAG TPA: tetratricopeptide repeat protein [Dissulfurispiraceae bacterium]|nr:tetratricopeptide repeat protein [Dissulfurispiraceae bacterium]